MSLQRTRAIHRPVDFTDIHKAMYGICDENIAMRETQSDDARAFDLSDLTNQIFREIFDFMIFL